MKKIKSDHFEQKSVSSITLCLSVCIVRLFAVKVMRIVAFVILLNCCTDSTRVGINIRCTHIYVGSTPIGKLLTCSDAFSGIEISSHQDTAVENVLHGNGTRVPNSLLRKFDSLVIENSVDLEFMPIGIKSWFCNLKSISITYCGLVQLDKIDMFQFGCDLCSADFEGNRLEYLPKRLFQYNTNLQFINLSDNPIKRISSRFFTNLRSLTCVQQVDLYDCKCIDQGYKRLRDGYMRNYVWKSETCRRGCREREMQHFSNNLCRNWEKCQ